MIDREIATPSSQASHLKRTLVSGMKHKISIQGMTCGGCAAKISSNLRAQPQVSRAVIDYATASGVVEGEITETLIKEVIEKSGYKVASVSAEIEIAENLSPSIFVDPDVRNLFFAGSIAVVVAALAMGPWAGQFLVLEGVLASIFLGGPGRLFFVRAWRQLLLKSVTMDTLISLGMLSAWGLSWVLLAQGHSHLYFESAVMIGFFVMLGKVLEERARKNSIQEIDRLVKLRPKSTWVYRDGQNPTEVLVLNVLVGDVLYVRPGDMVAVDGLIVEGSAAFDESVVSGESLPIVKQAGEFVPSGAVNAGATGIKLRATRIGQNTTIEQIVGMMEEARLARPKVQLFADRVSSIFVPIVMLLAGLTFLGWLLLGRVGIEQALLPALSVLVVACPCALGLAMPVAWVAGLGRSAKAGILVRSYQALETLAKTTTLVFDKTGTLTLGRPEIVSVHWADISFNVEITREQAFQGIRSALGLSSHPLAQTAATWLREKFPNAKSAEARLIHETAGEGVLCELRGLGEHPQSVRFGRPDFVLQGINERVSNSISNDISDDISNTIGKNLGKGPWENILRSQNSLMAISVDTVPLVLFEFKDSPRTDAKESLSALKAGGRRIIVASGDRNDVVDNLKVSFPEIDEVYGELRPEAKRQLIQKLKNSGEIVAFVGDGINDGLALAEANVGLAMGSGTDIALTAAGLVLQKSGLLSIVEAIELSGRITRVIGQNFFWAFFYNIAAIPLAMMGLMTPMWASLAMALSSVTVVLNALRLKA